MLVAFKSRLMIVGSGNGTQADLFAIIKAVEKLEKAWVRDLISAKEYESECFKLIGQFKTIKTTLEWDVDDVEKFMKDYNMVCPAAKNRLITSGMPATVEHQAPKSQDETNAGKKVAETVQHFITAMDSLKLDMRAVDQVFCLCSKYDELYFLYFEKKKLSSFENV